MKRISLKHKQVYIACQKKIYAEIYYASRNDLSFYDIGRSKVLKELANVNTSKKQFQCSKKSHAYVPLSIRLKTIRFFSVASASAELGHIFCNVMLFCRFSCVFRLVFWVAFFSL